MPRRIGGKYRTHLRVLSTTRHPLAGPRSSRRGTRTRWMRPCSRRGWTTPRSAGPTRHPTAKRRDGNAPVRCDHARVSATHVGGKSPTLRSPPGSGAFCGGEWLPRLRTGGEPTPRFAARVSVTNGPALGRVRRLELSGRPPNGYRLPPDRRRAPLDRADRGVSRQPDDLRADPRDPPSLRHAPH